MNPSTRRWARTLFVAAIGLVWILLIVSTTAEDRPRMVGMMILSGAVVGASEFFLRRTALDEDARELVNYFLLGALLALADWVHR